MIRSYRSSVTEAVARGRASKGFPADIMKSAQRKLTMLNLAARIEDLLSPPGNRLEALKGNRKGQHSIRINDQWRICFIWSDGGADQVEIVDYHD
ncbi:type II toxin-antitoxin system RelE/ParE family toxin [Rhizobium sp. TH2]|uniref:type II toxin-antitoxin system RelE/ParE family toxin n=1 Tax=Rhizobium sp. TH2 TaxID=2775403 RepID=UPI0021578069|nr:type II toxin-antitoxin system RelE/ParE family toxin [Rhizobium sp. TH2]UVC08204.1 type II toxin-antitoxin system RelE/ParE family toxin [Rhizobium sp. TH2]